MSESVWIKKQYLQDVVKQVKDLETKLDEAVALLKEAKVEIDECKYELGWSSIEGVEDKIDEFLKGVEG